MISEGAPAGGDWVRGLLRPEAFEHPVGALQLIETHVSWVVLTGDYAYKIKKPVALGFLDFSSPEARRRFCEEEVRLNRRLAPAIYLEVVPIGGSPAAPRVGRRAGVFEHAVRMRQFPQTAQLDRRLARGELTAAEIDAVADMVAGFHAGAPLSEDPAAGTAAAALEPFHENLAALREHLSDPGAAADLAALERCLDEEGEALRPVFAARRTNGFVRDVHGDLHLRNIAWSQSGPFAFDCIEFDDALRNIDVINDLAFLVMDLRHTGTPAFAQRLLNRYLERTGDYEGAGVLRFYLAYRASVRAKIDAIRAGQAAGAAEGDASRDEAVAYLALARHCCDRGRARLIITSGMSGSGKSTLSTELLAPLQAIRIRSDVERKRLAGLEAEQRAGSAYGTGLYGAGATERTYERLAECARRVLQGGYTALVDASFGAAAQRRRFRQLAAEAGVPFRILELNAPPQTLRERVAARSHGPSDADLSVLEHQIRDWEPLGPEERAGALVVDTVAEPAAGRLARALMRDA